ncbi:uncharacterized protein PAN0_002c1360 [Moesziomyces antarcticus]|uniref:uncharacterized protein n=1 Tax=Pseudozyma antarctica TaxID=84753 RepID=UPI00071966F4|nr:uncharacterized protein PAN0_002c1360 [Moesziomyces antarcticus]GAK63157.1 hypothetical protein PAN0_002c1360 [Moesziomyces antarcticus]
MAWRDAGEKLYRCIRTHARFPRMNRHQKKPLRSTPSNPTLQNTERTELASPSIFRQARAVCDPDPRLSNLPADTAQHGTHAVWNLYHLLSQGEPGRATHLEPRFGVRLRPTTSESSHSDRATLHAATKSKCRRSNAAAALPTLVVAPASRQHRTRMHSSEPCPAMPGHARPCHVRIALLALALSPHRVILPACMDAMPSSHARASPHAGCAGFSFGSSIGCLGLPPGWSDTSLDLRFMLVSDPARRALQLAPKVQPAKSMTRRHCGTDTLHAGLGARLKIQRGSVGSAGFCGASMNEMSSTRRREQRLPIFASVPVPLSAVSPRTTTVDDTRIAANGPVPDRALPKTMRSRQDAMGLSEFREDARGFQAPTLASFRPRRCQRHLAGTGPRALPRIPRTTPTPSHFQPPTPVQ